MNPYWYDDELLILQDAARRFMQQEILPNMEAWSSAGIVDRAVWKKAGDAGFLGVSVPEVHGGAGGTYRHEAVIALEQARIGDTGWALNLHSICTHYILALGNPEQKERWLPGLISGDTVPAIAMTEPGTGSDLQAIRTQARVVDGGYLVNGAKTFISNGQSADLIIVVLQIRDATGHGSMSLLVLDDTNTPGFKRGRNLEKLGMKSQDTSELFFDDVFIPYNNLLGSEPGKGFTQLMNQLPWERLLIAITAVGVSELMIDMTLDYVSKRKAFSKRILDFQNTRFVLAECKTKLEITRAYVEKCVDLVARSELDTTSASMAKWWAAQIQCEIADECLQLHGGYGYMMEYPIARLYADSRIQQIYGGTREIMKEIIGRSLEPHSC